MHSSELNIWMNEEAKVRNNSMRKPEERQGTVAQWAAVSGLDIVRKVRQRLSRDTSRALFFAHASGCMRSHSTLAAMVGMLVRSEGSHASDGRKCVRGRFAMVVHAAVTRSRVRVRVRR